MINSYIKSLKLKNHLILTIPSNLTFPASPDRETIQPNLCCKSVVKFLHQPQDHRKHKSRTEKLGKDGLK